MLSIDPGSPWPKPVCDIWCTPGADPAPGEISPHPSGEPLQSQSQGQPWQPQQLEIRVILPTSVIQGIRDAGKVESGSWAGWGQGGSCAVGMEGMRKTWIFSICFARNKWNRVRTSFSHCSCALLGISPRLKADPVHCLRAGPCPGPRLDDGRNVETPALGLDWSRNQDRKDPQALPFPLKLHQIPAQPCPDHRSHPRTRTGAVRTFLVRLWMWSPGLDGSRHGTAFHGEFCLRHQ